MVVYDHLLRATAYDTGFVGREFEVKLLIMSEIIQDRHTTAGRVSVVLCVAEKVKSHDTGIKN